MNQNHNHTKYTSTIINGFLTLCERKKFSDITMQDIADECHISRRTIYNHFHDKYEIMNYLYYVRLDKAREAAGPEHDLLAGFTHMCRTWAKHPDYYRSVFSFTGQNSYTDLLMKDLKRSARLMILEKTGEEPDEEVLFQLDFFCRASIYTVYQWVMAGAASDPDTLAAYLFGCLPPKLAKML